MPGPAPCDRATVRREQASGRRIDPTPGPAVTPAEPPEREPGAARRILIADDNEDAARTLEVLLGLGGHQVCVALDGQEALDLASTFRPDVALLDIGMPRLTGHEVARRLRQDPRFDGTWLIALTGWGQDLDRRKSEEVGFDRHLVKPIDPATLMALIASLAEAGARR